MLLALFVFLLVWQVAYAAGLYQTVIVPPPTAILAAVGEMYASGELVRDILASLQRAAVGFLTGSCAGVLIGVFTGRVRLIDATLGQLIRLFRSIPSIALVPVAIVWFGLGETSKYVLVFWGVFFPVWINTHLGITQVDRTYIWAAQSLGARRAALIWEVVLPCAVPFIVAGMRTATAIAFVVLVAAEMAGAFGGVGYRIYASHLVFRVDKMMADIFVLGLLGGMADLLFAAVISAIPWHQERGGNGSQY